MPQMLARPSTCRLRLAACALLLGAGLAASPCLAQPGWGGGWGGGWGPGWGGGRAMASDSRDPREGRVNAERFVSEGAFAALGHGAIQIKSLPGTTVDEREQATYEAAVIDQLAKAGYDTVNPPAAADGGQIVEMTVSHDMLVPEEEKRKPLSGSAMMGVSNRGSMMAVELNYDASKPRAALIATHVELRIRERATGRALYEARADVATREGDKHWSDTAIAARLAGAAFEHFPSNSPR